MTTMADDLLREARASIELGVELGKSRLPWRRARGEALVGMGQIKVALAVLLAEMEAASVRRLEDEFTDEEEWDAP